MRVEASRRARPLSRLREFRRRAARSTAAFAKNFRARGRVRIGSRDVKSISLLNVHERECRVRFDPDVPKREENRESVATP
jgi:hypothetical protein